ncbi:MAG: indole-3-glycerol phosphate synthase TrpC [Acidobacteriota bacterium]
MSDFLENIVARTRERLAEEPPPDRPAAEIAARNRPPYALTSAISRNGISIIAEIKAASPSAGTIVENPDVEAIAREYKAGGAAAISVVTERDWFHGSRDWIARAATASGLPVLMKDFIVDEAQLVRGVAAGASAILLLASLLDAGQIRAFIACLDQFTCDALVEVHDERELERAVGGGARLIGVNNRNLRDFGVDLGTSERLSKLMPPNVMRVAESGIKSRQDIDHLRGSGFHAFLVGESLLRQNDRAAAVRRLLS